MSAGRGLESEKCVGNRVAEERRVGGTDGQVSETNGGQGRHGRELVPFLQLV